MQDLFWKVVRFFKPRWHLRNPGWPEYVLLALAYGSIAFLAAVVLGSL